MVAAGGDENSGCVPVGDISGEPNECQRESEGKVEVEYDGEGDELLMEGRKEALAGSVSTCWLPGEDDGEISRIDGGGDVESLFEFEPDEPTEATDEGEGWKDDEDERIGVGALNADRWKDEDEPTEDDEEVDAEDEWSCEWECE